MSDPALPPRPVLPVLGAALAVSVLTTWYALGPYFHAFNTPHTAIEGAPHAPSPIPVTPGLARRLVIVMTDGVSFEAARSLPELAALRRAGVIRPLRAEFPTFTSPAITSFFTGLSPRDSGTRLNGGLDSAAGLDSVLAEAGAAGVPIRVWSREWEPFLRLTRAPPGVDFHAGRIGALDEIVSGAARARPDLPPMEGKSAAREISLFYIGEVDEAAHYHGIRSPEVEDAEHVAAALVNRIAGTLDLDQDSLIVLSDHGHRPEGGHGGLEPLVTSAFLLAAGGLLRHGVEIAEPRPLRDVASTISVLAGVPVPSSNLGRPMLDLLSIGDPETSYLLGAPFDEAAHFLCRLSPNDRCAEVDPLVARLRPVDLRRTDPAAWEEANALHDALTEARDRALAARAKEAAERRISIAIAAIAAALAAAAWIGRRQLRLLLDVTTWILAPLNAVVYAALLYRAGYRPTFSTMKAAPYFIGDALLPTFAAAVAVIAVAIARRPKRLAPWVLLFGTAIPFAILAAIVGCDPAVLPPPVLGILVFELGPAVIGAALGATALALIEARWAARAR